MRIDLLLLTLFWSIAYVFAIVHGLKYKEHAIPPFSVSLNFSWEIVASIMNKEYIDIVWVILDVFIVILLISEYIKEKNKKFICYILSFFIYGIICIVLFHKALPGGISGFVFLSFTMDLIMAIDYINEFSKRKNVNTVLLLVTVFRLLGDFTAFLIYKDFLIVKIEGILVFLINIVYLTLVLLVLTKRKSISDLNWRKLVLINREKSTRDIKSFFKQKKPSKKKNREWQSTKKKYKKKK